MLLLNCAKATITLADTLNDFDILLPGPQLNLKTKEPANVSRPQDITMADNFFPIFSQSSQDSSLIGEVGRMQVLSSAIKETPYAMTPIANNNEYLKSPNQQSGMLNFDDDSSIQIEVGRDAQEAPFMSPNPSISLGDIDLKSIAPASVNKMMILDDPLANEDMPMDFGFNDLDMPLGMDLDVSTGELLIAPAAENEFGAFKHQHPFNKSLLQAEADEATPRKRKMKSRKSITKVALDAEIAISEQAEMFQRQAEGNNSSLLRPQRFVHGSISQKRFALIDAQGVEYYTGSSVPSGLPQILRQLFLRCESNFIKSAESAYGSNQLEEASVEMPCSLIFNL